MSKQEITDNTALLNCPKCGASLNLEIKNNVLFCPYCGHKILLNGKEWIDASLKISEMEHEEREADKNREEQRFKILQEQKRWTIKAKLIVAAALTVLVCIGWIYLSHVISVTREERKLQKAYDSALQDINDGNYDSAKLKAYTLYYTANDNSKKEKWDGIRQKLIARINDEEPQDNSVNTSNFINTTPEVIEDAYDIFDGPINPSEEFVISKLKKIKSVTGIEAATEDKDYNEQLNKPGGYTSDIFFSHKKIDEDDFFSKHNDGKSVGEVGTTGGGSVEVYKTFDDAVKRCNYLYATHMFLRGQREAIIGTSILRLSEHLSASEQQDFIDELVKYLNE